MLKVGLVGYGFMGHMHADCYLASGEAAIAAVADVQAGKRDEAAAALGCEVFDSLESMLNSVDVDIVDICLPTGLHESHAIMALERGKHMICEKPMALTVEACDRIIEAAEKSNAKAMVAHVIRFWPEYQVVKRIVDSGEIGAVRWVSARRMSPLPMWSYEGWMIDPVRSGGAILDMAIHDVDFIAYLVGPPGKLMTVGTPDGASVLSLGWEHTAGAKSSIEVSFAFPPGFPFTMALTVSGERGTIRFDSSQTPSLVVYPASGGSYVPDVPKPAAGRATTSAGNVADLGGYLNEIKYFVDCVKSDKMPDLVTLIDAREAVRTCLASRQSLDSSEPVSL